jgi:glycopeptide antibiotics resistance protein
VRLKALTAVVLLAIGAVTLTPQPHTDHELRLVPFSDIADAVANRSLAQAAAVLGNVLLFLPLGAVLRLQGLRVRRVIVAGCVLSLAIELAQLAIPGRTTSTDDVLLNTAGAALGAVAALRLPARQ